jgi:hypothetical protein
MLVESCRMKSSITKHSKHVSTAEGGFDPFTRTTFHSHAVSDLHVGGMLQIIPWAQEVHILSSVQLCPLILEMNWAEG